MVAFEYGYSAKGRHFIAKVGFDEAFSRFSPGQLLRRVHYEELIETGSSDTIDYLGPLTEATGKWATNRYRLGVLSIAPSPWLARASGGATCVARSLRGRLRGDLQ